MTTKKKTAMKPGTPTAPAQKPSAFHRLDALLHTLRSIAQYEDALCELTHEVKRSGQLTPETSEEVRGILEKIPSHDYMHDLDSVNGLLGEPPKARAAVPKKRIKPGTASKRPAVAKKSVASKSPGRKSSK